MDPPTPAGDEDDAGGAAAADVGESAELLEQLVSSTLTIATAANAARRRDRVVRSILFNSLLRPG
jgi:hypothetical protein